MRLLILNREISELVILLILLIICQGKKHLKNNDDSTQESESTFITIRLPANVASHNKDCVYEGSVRHHGDAWSPGPCIPECRCTHGHVKCSKIECPDLNCDRPIKKKWKCCPECLPLMDNETTCGVWSNGGNGNGGCCVFPFEYNGVKHYTCTYLDHNKPWCSISTNFDRDGVWGECIDEGDTPKTLRFKDHKGEAQQQDNSTDALISNIANNVVNSVSNESANVSNPSPVTPGSNVTIVPSESVGVAATVSPSSAQPSQTVVIPVTSAIVTSPAATLLPSPSSSAGGPVPQASSSSVVQPASNQTFPIMASSVQPATSQSVSQAGQTAVIGQPGAVPTPPLGMGSTASGAATPQLPGPAPQVTQQPQPQVTQQPQPQVTQQPQPQVTQQPTPQPTQQPAPTLPEQPIPQPGQQPAAQPAPAPAPVPGQPPVAGVTPGSPFPISQTTLTPGETQAAGNAPGVAGQAVHQLTTTEESANHNITTTESWFGKPNETLNRTNEVMSQSGQVNQASYGYQAALSQQYDQNQASYNDQPSYSQPDYSSYNTQSSPQADSLPYNSQSSPENNYPSYYAQSYGSYDNTAYQQYDRSRAQDTAGQANYYSNEQQYQQQYGADPGSYYTG